MFHAFMTIVKSEGLLSCWKGATPTVVRAMALNLGMLVSYDVTKEKLEKKVSANQAWFAASLVSGAVASTVSLPFDNVKTKLQKQVPLEDGTLKYSGLIDCAKQTVAKEGPTRLWAGLPTYIFRIAPHVMITLVASEYLKKLVK